MVVSFCIKEPLDFTRVPYIELKFSKFPGEIPPIPPMGGSNPLPYLTHFMPSLAGSISKTTVRQIS